MLKYRSSFTSFAPSVSLLLAKREVNRGTECPMKKCTNCGETKEFSEFYTDRRTKNGLYARCKRCHYVKSNCVRRPPRTQEEQELLNEYRRVLRNMDISEYQKRPEQQPRVAARRLTHEAIKTGKIKRGNCSVCGEPNAHAHHEDYSKPLEVMWFCRLHHKHWHMGKITN